MENGPANTQEQIETRGCAPGSALGGVVQDVAAAGAARPGLVERPVPPHVFTGFAISSPGLSDERCYETLPPGEEKACSRCQRVLPLDQFGRDPRNRSGRHSWCRSCIAANTRKYIREHPGYNRHSRADMTPAQREAQNEAFRRWAKEHPKACAARAKVHRAIKSGKLTPQPCALCGCLRVIGHHEDYDRPLDVLWVCRKCHKAIHADRESEAAWETIRLFRHPRVATLQESCA